MLLSTKTTLALAVSSIVLTGCGGGGGGDSKPAPTNEPVAVEQTDIEVPVYDPSTPVDFQGDYSIPYTYNPDNANVYENGATPEQTTDGTPVEHEAPKPFGHTIVPTTDIEEAAIEEGPLRPVEPEVIEEPVIIEEPEVPEIPAIVEGAINKDLLVDEDDENRIAMFWSAVAATGLDEQIIIDLCDDAANPHFEKRYEQTSRCFINESGKPIVEFTLVDSLPDQESIETTERTASILTIDLAHAAFAIDITTSFTLKPEHGNYIEQAWEPAHPPYNNRHHLKGAPTQQIRVTEEVHGGDRNRFTVTNWYGVRMYEWRSYLVNAVANMGGLTSTSSDILEVEKLRARPYVDTPYGDVLQGGPYVHSKVPVVDLAPLINSGWTSTAY